MTARVGVLIVGAGPVGLTLACHLRRLGLDVRVVDKLTGPSVQSKAIGLQYRVSEILARLGVIDRFLAGENHVWLHRDGSLAALPLPAGNTWRLFVEVTRQAGHLAGAPSLEDIKTYIAQRAPSMAAAIIGDPLWLSDFRINCRIASRLHDGRVFLAGDAAHIHSPTGGQGITTGMQDAVNLAWKLDRVARGAPRALLDTYDEERLPHAAEVLAETDRTTTLLFAPTVTLRLLRDLVVLPVLRNAWVQRRMFGKLSQLHVHYRNSSLSYERVRGWHRKRVRAGDRVPDVVFGRAATRGQTSLFQLMFPLRPVGIFNGIDDPAALCRRLQHLDIDGYELGAANVDTGADNGGALIDIYGDFRRLFGAGATFCA